jgi:hypothetical protein
METSPVLFPRSGRVENSLKNIHLCKAADKGLQKEKIDVLVIGRNYRDYIAIVNRFPQEMRRSPWRAGLWRAADRAARRPAAWPGWADGWSMWESSGTSPGLFCLKRLQDFEVNTDHVEIVPGGKLRWPISLSPRSRMIVPSLSTVLL